MAVDDLWYRKGRDPVTDERRPSARHGRGQRWRVRYTDDSGDQVTRSFERKTDADRFDAGVRTDVSRGLYIDPTAGQETVAAYGERYRQAQFWRGATAEAAERAFRLHIDPVLGSRALVSVRPSHVQRWVKDLDLSPASARVVFSVLSAMFTSATQDRAIAVSPCQNITLPELPHTDHVILTPEQVHTMAANIPERWRAMVYVGAGCGLRSGEVMGLERRHVDFLRREIHVQQQMVTYTGRKPHLAPPKSRSSRRVVELPQVVADALARHFEKFPPVPVELEDDTDPRRKGRTRSAELIFTNSLGRPIYRNNLAKTWAAAAKKVGLQPKTGFHALRHYYATLLIFAGANVKTVQTALGHSSPMITLNTYVGLWPDQLDRTRSLVDAALGTTSVRSGTR